ncbi:unnamed protein product [Ambrosiozyma monospora]|uniref:Unnamed protein product n=1 Tax=Ambrosiozyma monospora TaxID=43982 RepID=A0A9W7DJV2_AMBMO|nr:unnamed protein product [Ambrosiozyma monospora]
MQHSENNFEKKNSKKDTSSNQKNIQIKNEFENEFNTNPGSVIDSIESVNDLENENKRKKRKVAAFACQACNKRKVRCDVASKNYPTERCTHCEEYDVKCIPVKRRKKRTKEQIEADRLREGNMDGFKFQFRFVSPTSFSNEQATSIDSSNSNINTTNNSYNTNSVSPGLNSFLVMNPVKNNSGKKPSGLNRSTDANQPSPSQNQNITSTHRKKTKNSVSLNIDREETVSKKSSFFSSSSTQRQVTAPSNSPSINHRNSNFETNLPISIDIDSHIARLVNPEKIFLLYRVTADKNNIPFLPQHLTLKDLVSKETLITLRITGCLILPSRATCQLYIDAYFLKHEELHPVLSKTKFLEDFNDLRNPPSLLMIWTMIYVGARVLASNEDERKLARLFYQKAKIVAESSIECEPIYYVLSQFILATRPSLTQTPMDIDRSLAQLIKIVIELGMNVNAKHFPYLTLEEKKTYKRLFWVLVQRDRMIGIALPRPFNMKDSSFIVDPLTPEDFLGMDGRSNEAMFFHSMQAGRFCALNRTIAVVQNKANDAFHNRQPFLKFHQQADETIAEIDHLLSTQYRSPCESYHSFTYYLFFLTTCVYTQRIHLYRLYNFILRGLKEERMNPGMALRDLPYESYAEINGITCWEKLYDAVSRAAKIIIEGIPKYHSNLVFSQCSVFICYEIGFYLAPFLFQDDLEKEKEATDLFKQLFNTLEQYTHVITWNIPDLVHTTMKELVKDRSKVLDLVHFQPLYRNNASVVRAAYKIKPLKNYALKTMILHKRIFEDGFHGDYKNGLFSIPKSSHTNNCSKTQECKGTDNCSDSDPNLDVEPIPMVAASQEPPPAHVMPSIAALVKPSRISSIMYPRGRNRDDLNLSDSNIPFALYNPMLESNCFDDESNVDPNVGLCSIDMLPSNGDV